MMTKLSAQLSKHDASWQVFDLRKKAATMTKLVQQAEFHPKSSRTLQKSEHRGTVNLNRLDPYANRVPRKLSSSPAFILCPACSVSCIRFRPSLEE